MQASQSGQSAVATGGRCRNAMLCVGSSGTVARPVNSSSSSRTATCMAAALWSRQPDDFDKQWEQEEASRRQQRQQVTLAQQAAEEAAWRQQVDQVHQQLLDQQKHKAALRQRLQQDAQRAKREQLRRIEPVAKARARAHGLASLGLDPEIIALSEKFGRLSGLVDEVQQRMELQYGSMASWDDATALGQLPPAPAGAGVQTPPSVVGPAAGQQQVLQQAAQQWPQPLQGYDQPQPHQRQHHHQQQQQQQQLPVVGGPESQCGVPQPAAGPQQQLTVMGTRPLQEQQQNFLQRQQGQLQRAPVQHTDGSAP